MARMVCEVGRQAALDGANAALAVAANPTAAAADQVRGIAAILARASLMQSELVRFAALAHNRQRSCKTQAPHTAGYLYEEQSVMHSRQNYSQVWSTSGRR